MAETDIKMWGELGEHVRELGVDVFYSIERDNGKLSAVFEWNGSRLKLETSSISRLVPYMPKVVQYFAALRTLKGGDNDGDTITVGG